MNFQKLHEAWRDNTRDLICDQLAAMGVDARLAERGRPEEGSGAGPFRSLLGLIDIAGSPIKWINVSRTGSHEGSSYHRLDYGINGPQNSSRVRIRAKPIRRFFFGSIKYAKWSGDDGGVGIMSQLANDPTIREAVLAPHVLPLQLEYRPPGELWLLKTELEEAPLLSSHPTSRLLYRYRARLPSQEEWHCYELIAARLSAMR